MGFMRVQHIQNPKSGLAEDAIVNTFHFVGPGTVDAASGNVMADIVRNFYWSENTGVGVNRVQFFLADNALAVQQSTAKVYDMEQPTPRVPVYTETAGIQANGKDPLPQEVALCLSYRAIPTSGSIQARERGRIYLGPVAELHDEWDPSAGTSRPTTAMMNSMLAAGKRTANEAAAAGWTWVIYSPTTAGTVPAGGGGEFGTFPVQEFLVDDAWDTIRSRGARRTKRLTTTVL